MMSLVLLSIYAATALGNKDLYLPKRLSLRCSCQWSCSHKCHAKLEHSQIIFLCYNLRAFTNISLGFFFLLNVVLIPIGNGKLILMTWIKNKVKMLEHKRKKCCTSGSMGGSQHSIICASPII